jgi:ubiquinone/menaquinone biosynthesis C-methylase UbiE
VYAGLSAASFAYTTRRGKIAVWRKLLEEQRLSGNERVLDLGCGRGLVLIEAARRLHRGRAVGVDSFRAKDQSGNAARMTLANARASGVDDRIDIVTADMRQLPFADATFDLVVSSLAVHNIDDAEGRRQAIREGLRVLKPGGTILLADLQYASDYVATLRNAGARDAKTRNLGWRFWYGGPFFATYLVRATKPRAADSSGTYTRALQ